jgi:hypothetical protein
MSERLIWPTAALMLAAPGLLFPINFNAPRVISLNGNYGYSVVLKDFNRDGQMDMAVAARQEPVTGATGFVEIFLGHGDGSFGQLMSYALPSVPANGYVNMLALDLNHDGKLDIAVATNLGVSILLGNGNGTFQAAVSYTAGDLPWAISSADFNNDGHPDLAVINRNSNNLSILLGKGDGTFQPAVSYATDKSPQALVAADFDGDGMMDVAVANNVPNRPGSLTLFSGVGDGTFHKPTKTAIGAGPVSMAAGDFNQDGKLDLAISGTSGLAVLLAAGGGEFLPPVTVNGGIQPAEVVSLDFNHDGKSDLAVGGSGTTDGYKVSIVTGNGDGTFKSPALYYVASFPNGMAFGDINGDGSLDLAVACADAGVTLLLQNSHGGLQQITTLAAGSRPFLIAAGDFNGDGKPDLAVGNSESDNISILLNEGNGTFLPQVTYNIPGPPSSVATGDFNGDGKLDIAFSVNGSLWLLPGNGDGTFQPPLNCIVDGAVLGVADFNRDGKLDVATAGTGTFFAFLKGNGNGTFEETRYFENQTAYLATGDFNGDGNPDAVIPNSICSSTTCTYLTDIWLGNGDGTFRYVSNLSPQISPLVTGDFNGDGKLDIAGNSSGGVSVMLGNGDGSLQPALAYSSPLSVAQLAAADFDHNGRLDLAASTTLNTVAFLSGNGDGTFAAPVQFVTGGCPAGLAVADFNGDGKPDLAVVNSCTNSISIITNTTKNTPKL